MWGFGIFPQEMESKWQMKWRLGSYRIEAMWVTTANEWRIPMSYSYSQYCLHNAMDMGSVFGTEIKIILDYKRNPYVHC